MTSRERVLSAIRHQEPDRVPIDLGATPSSGISAVAYSNLVKFLDLPDARVRVYDVVQELAEPEDSILDRFGIDAIDIGRGFNTNPEKWKPVQLYENVAAEYPQWFSPTEVSPGLFEVHQNGELLARKPAGATFYDQTLFPYEDEYPGDYADLPRHMNRVMWSSLAHSPWDHAGEPRFWDDLRAHALSLQETTDRALMVVVGGNLFEWGTFLRRIDNFMMDIYTDQAEVEKLLDALVAIHLETLAKVCTAVGDIVDVVRFGDDLGMDSGPFMSPQHYRDIFQPRHRLMTDFVKKNSTMVPFLHSCGSIYQLLPGLIDAGFEIINPVQTNCIDMEPERLKKEFGKDVTFWGGGVDTRSVLNRGSRDEVKRQVWERLKILAPGGGFVFNTIHNILPDVPPENIVAMYEAIHEYYR